MTGSMRRLFFLIAIAACGGSSKKPAPDPAPADPAWAADYQHRAAAGCECTDPACLEAAHAELAALETQHGGMDEAPPSVHAAHGTFDRCWREGTRDITRDFEHAAQAICTCATAECLRLAKIELAGLVDGKYRENLDQQFLANPDALVAANRAGDCIHKATMPAAEALAVLERTTDAMCACTDFGCAQAAMQDRAKSTQSYLDIDPALDATQVSDLGARWCKCLEKVAANEIKNLSPMPSLTSVDISMKCN